MPESSEPSWWQCRPSKLPRYPPHHLLQAFDNARIWKSSFMTIKKEILYGNNWVRLFHVLSCSDPCIGPSVFCPPPLPLPPHWRLGQWMAAYLLTYKWDSWCPQLLPFPRCQQVEVSHFEKGISGLTQYTTNKSAYKSTNIKYVSWKHVK